MLGVSVGQMVFMCSDWSSESLVLLVRVIGELHPSDRSCDARWRGWRVCEYYSLVICWSLIFCTY